MKDGCPFCDYEGPSKVLAHYPEYGCFIIEPINRVTPGHVLAVPYDHVASFIENPLYGGDAARAAAQYAHDTGIESCNLIVSAGAAATQTVPHVHVHVVPRRKDDGLMLPWSPG